MGKIRIINHSVLFIIPLLVLAMVMPSGIYASEDENPVLEISIKDAIMLALENNSAFKIEKMKPAVRESREIQENALFDLGFSGSFSMTDDKSSDSSSKRTNIKAGVSQNLKTGGDISLDLSSGKTSGTTENPYSSSLELGFNHPLMQDAGVNVTVASIKKAELSFLSSKYELHGYAESLVSQVMNSYWDYAFAERQLDIYDQSLKLAQQQLDETKTMIEVGKLAEIELVASEAEVSSRKEALINARSNLDKSRIKLVRLINPPEGKFWTRQVKLTDSFETWNLEIEDMDAIIENALKLRPDLNETRLLIEQNKLDVLVTKNGVLPVMNLFVTLGMSGYSNSFTDSIKDISSSDRNLQAGLNFSQAIGNRSDRERYRQSKLSEAQNLEALTNLTQLAIEDVGISYLEINRTKEQISATAVSRKLQEEKVRAETEKYRVGKSTSLLVAQAQRDLTASQINEIQAIINYNKALVDLLRNEGTLLKKYGISYIE
jgi:outer membrane protein